ncbi:hypothetical protein PGTUg99_004948 [Puccinia graminis f. sp. tritici]|uniref:Uncharacterized protein n=1 Tax=Puccinia graminis f. sp. tritici TaxID=56615 RepID=A0A5B0MNV2_PUCGR|nr:hypothetical protein PGTUg99_004948 [Puccinia graminis f. sp. tritici]
MHQSKKEANGVTDCNFQPDELKISSKSSLLRSSELKRVSMQRFKLWAKDEDIPPFERIGEFESTSPGTRPVSQINNRVVGFALRRKRVKIWTQDVKLRR